MKKSIKIVLCIVVPLTVLITTYIILIVKGILPNPFLDTSDLVCSRESIFGLLTYKEEVIIKFDKFQRVNQHISIDSFIYETLEDAQDAYNNLDDKEVYKLNKEENSIEFEKTISITKDNSFYKKNKQQMKDFYINELFYTECK